MWCGESVDRRDEKQTGQDWRSHSKHGATRNRNPSSAQSDLYTVNLPQLECKAEENSKFRVDSTEANADDTISKRKMMSVVCRYDSSMVAKFDANTSSIWSREVARGRLSDSVERGSYAILSSPTIPVNGPW